MAKTKKQKIQDRIIELLKLGKPVNEAKTFAYEEFLTSKQLEKFKSSIA